MGHPCTFGGPFSDLRSVPLNPQKMSNQQVTKGRIVEFFPGDSHRVLPHDQSWPAIVTGVYDGCVHLVVFSDFGTLPTGTLVSHKQEAVEGRDYWDWFPVVPDSPSVTSSDHSGPFFDLIKAALYAGRFIAFFPGKDDGFERLVNVAIGEHLYKFDFSYPTIDRYSHMAVIPFDQFSAEHSNEILTPIIQEGGGK